ncbi:Annexin repeat [Dillenia turbinata]|uniref:Annexin repeat n=1 Tax=Dillenia turbinata TaxID=194707 RepID=A0AAN8ZBB0_9MAGN
MATIVAPLEHSAAEDAQAIREAVKGWGTDKDALISILAHRYYHQRNEIRKAYQHLYEEDLIRRLESELKGSFEGAIYRWIPEPADRDALLANIALRKGKFNHRVIVEVSCARHPEEFLAAKRAYFLHYRHSMEEDVASHTTGALRKLMVALVGVYRYDGDEIDEELAVSEAETLHYFIEENAFGHDEIIRIVSTRSKKQLLATINRYKDNHGTSITKTLARIADNVVADALYAAIGCLTDQTKYYEKVLRNALHNRTDEDALTRVIVTQAERYLWHIKDLYYRRNSERLEEAVAKETRGHYEDFLLALLGNHN